MLKRPATLSWAWTPFSDSLALSEFCCLLLAFQPPRCCFLLVFWDSHLEYTYNLGISKRLKVRVILEFFWFTSLVLEFWSHWQHYTLMFFSQMPLRHFQKPWPLFSARPLFPVQWTSKLWKEKSKANEGVISMYLPTL